MLLFVFGYSFESVFYLLVAEIAVQGNLYVIIPGGRFQVFHFPEKIQQFFSVFYHFTGSFNLSCSPKNAFLCISVSSTTIVRSFFMFSKTFSSKSPGQALLSTGRSEHLNARHSAAGRHPGAGSGGTPPPAIVTRGDFYAGQGLSITAFYWYGTGHPVMGTGHLDTAATPSSLDYAGKPRPAPGAIVSIPIGKYHSIHVSYFRVQGVGNPTAPEALIIYGARLPAG